MRRVSEEEWDSERADLLFFRGQALGIVRHFFEIASQIGRVPSILGREFFRAKVTHHAIPSFEEQAVFVHDVERALGKLKKQDAELVALVGLLRYSLDEVAALLGCSRSYVQKRFTAAVDELAEGFLATGLLREDKPDRYVQQRGLRGMEGSSRVPKKPVQSVVGEPYVIGRQAAGYSFAEQAGRVCGSSSEGSLRLA